MTSSPASLNVNQHFRVTADGFVVSVDGKNLAYADNQVEGIKYVVTRDGQALGDECVRHDLRLRIADRNETKWVHVVREVGPFDHDSLKAFRRRLLTGLTRRALSQLRRGREIHGDEWSLDLVGLTYEPTDMHWLIQQLCGARRVGDELWVYHEDFGDRPVLRLSVEAENTALLHQVLLALVANVDDIELDDTAGLGRHVADFSTKHRHPIPFQKLAGVTCLAIAALICTLPLSSVAIGAMFFSVISVALMPLLQPATESLRQFQHGLIWSCGRHQHVMLLEQIGRMRVQWDGGERRSEVAKRTALFEFAETDPSQMPLRMPIVIEGEGLAAADTLGAAVASHLADRMEVRLQSEGHVAWTEYVTLTRDAIRYRNAEIESRIAFHDIVGINLTRQRLTLSAEDGTPLLTLATSAWNFYSGMILFERMHDKSVATRSVNGLGDSGGPNAADA